MLTVKEAFFNLNDEEETKEERLRECIFVRDVIKNICKDTLNKARKSNQMYNKMSKEMLECIQKNLGDREIKSAHFVYKKDMK